MAGIRDRPRPLELTGGPQLGKQQRVQPLPDARPLPLIQTAVAGRASAEAELERQMSPGDPRVQHEQDPLQRLPIRQPLPARIAEAALHLRQQRLDPLPQPVRHDPRRNSHRHPSQLDDRCRRRSSSGNGSLHFGSSSYAVTGVLGLARRDGNRRYYDLLERLLPPDVLARKLPLEEQLRHKLLSRYRAHGLLGVGGGGDVFGGLGPAKPDERWPGYPGRNALREELVERGDLVSVEA